MIKYNELGKLIAELQDQWEKEESTIKEVYSSWQSGEAVDLPLEAWKSLVINYSSVEENLNQALDKFKFHAESGIFGIIGERQYGTGKSQYSKFLKHKLEVPKVIDRDLTKINPMGTVKGIRSRIKDLFSWKDVERILVVIGETDLLATKKNARELLEKFADEIISWKKLGKNRDTPISVLLDISGIANEKIERYVKSRLDRRIVKLIHAEERVKNQEMLEDMAKKILSLVTIIHEDTREITQKGFSPLSNKRYKYLSGMANFLNDLVSTQKANYLNTPIGAVISDLLKKWCEPFLDHLDLSKLQKISTEEFKTLGYKLEKMMKDYLMDNYHRIEAEINGKKYIAILKDENLKLEDKIFGERSRESDWHYIVTPPGGLKTIGKIPLEITVEKKISKRKEEQLLIDAYHYPTLLLHGYGVKQEQEREKINAIYEQSKNDIEVIGGNRRLLRYALAMKQKRKKFIDEVFNIQLLSDFIRNSTETFLEEERAIGKIEAPEREEAPLSLQEEFQNRIKSSVHSAITAFGFERKGGKTYKEFSTFRETIAEKLMKTIKNFDEVELQPLGEQELHPRIKDVLKNWEEEGLAEVRWNTKTQRVYPAIQPNREYYSFLNSANEWSNKKAIELTMTSLLPSLLDRYGENLESS